MDVIKVKITDYLLLDNYFLKGCVFHELYFKTV